MDSNLVIDYTTWERGKDFPEYMDEVALATISKGYFYLVKHLKKHTEELLMQWRND
jgi:hypothetical protein